MGEAILGLSHSDLPDYHNFIVCLLLLCMPIKTDLKLGLMWWHAPVIPRPRKMGQLDYEC